jgi:hypothetical protein
MSRPAPEAAPPFTVTVMPVEDPGHARLAAALEILLEGDKTPEEAAG